MWLKPIQFKFINRQLKQTAKFRAMAQRILFLFVLFIFISCSKNQEKVIQTDSIHQPKDTLIIDCNYTFEEAIAGSNAPQYIIDQLILLDVVYYSTNNKIHKGQILTNKRIAEDIRYMFDFMFIEKFPIAHAIPIVKYNWNDSLSMQDNNTYSFCYRNVSYSAHALGMAIDINPFFNPIRWKEGHKYGHRKDGPDGAVSNPKVKGTFTAESPVVLEFTKRRFHWGHNMTEKFDDHHFEKAGLRMPKKIEADSIFVQDSIQQAF